MNHSSFIKPGVLYGIRTVGSYNLQATYYFGRSKTQALRNLAGEATEERRSAQKEILRSRCKRNGLHAPRDVFLWVGVEDVESAWDRFKQRLRWSPDVEQVQELGDNWFTSTLSSDNFPVWCRATATALFDAPRVQQVGRHAVIEGPVSSEYAAALLLGALQLPKEDAVKQGQ